MKHSLTLCASILLLSPFAMAIRPHDAQINVSLGNRSVAIGDRTKTSTDFPLLAGAKATSTVAAAGTVTGLEHSTPVGILSASAKIPLGSDSDHSIKFGVDVLMSNSDVHKVYDGQSTTGSATLFGVSSVLTVLNTVDAESGVSVKSITGGKRELTVEHKPSYGLKALYSMGDNYKGAGVGISLLWTQDEYKYTVEETKAAAAGVGVHSAGTLAESLTFADAEEDAAATKDLTYALDTGDVHKYDDKQLWLGVVGEGETAINDNFSVKSSFGYYMKEFEVSKNPTLSAPIVVKATDSTMYVGSFGVGLRMSKES